LKPVEQVLANGKRKLVRLHRSIIWHADGVGHETAIDFGAFYHDARWRRRGDGDAAAPEQDWLVALHFAGHAFRSRISRTARREGQDD
jgi:hypothetical protein